MKEVKERAWNTDEHGTWKSLFERLDNCRRNQAHTIFVTGIRELGLNEDGIPDLATVNQRLEAKTGWRGVFVEGLVDGGEFLKDLAARRFPIGNFIRDKGDLNYTPAPDIFHDLYGHLPFLMDPHYARFCEELGKLATKYEDNKKAIRMCERLFWFGVEFPVIETPHGRRIFGGGILSSFGESNYALSLEPEVVPFDLRDIVNRDYNIDEMQRRIYLLSSPADLYNCLPALDKLLAAA
jgi:phenylalanine-4-hydroxylase